MPLSLAKQSIWRECNLHVEHDCTVLVSQLDKRHCVGGSYSGVRLPRDCLYFPSLQELISACLMNVGIHTPLYLAHSRLKILPFSIGQNVHDRCTGNRSAILKVELQLV